MNSEDLDRIEDTLGISLPASYRQVMLDYPIPAYAGNNEIDLWDDADSLIARNLELRTPSKFGPKPWPTHFYCLGGESTVYAMDLRESDGPVWWVEHSHLDSENTSIDSPSFSDWVQGYVDAVRSDLEGDGYDPDGTPETRDKLEWRNARASCLGCLALLGGLIALVALFWYFFV